jgi:hypothetical protein
MEQIQTEIVENSTDGLDLFRNYIIINIWYCLYLKI